MKYRVTAPASIRIVVKLAGSMAVCRRAMRQRTELPAKANMASRVETIIRGFKGLLSFEGHIHY
jgi:hypothetical protein